MLWLVVGCGASTHELELRRRVDELTLRSTKLESELHKLSHQLLLFEERENTARAGVPQHLEVVRLAPPAPAPASDEGPIEITMIGEADFEPPPLKPAPLPPPPRAPEGDQSFRAALTAYREGRASDAAKLLRQFIDANPKHPNLADAWYWLGEARFELRAYGEAIAAFSILREKYPSSGKGPDALLKLGLAYERSGDTARAKSTLEELVRNHPTSALADVARGRLGVGGT